jgi:hypothetical protein
MKLDINYPLSKKNYSSATKDKMDDEAVALIG